MQIKQQKIAEQSFGPQSALPMTKGLNENCKRPTGGGKNGLVLGSEREAPTGMTVALSLGQI